MDSPWKYTPGIQAVVERLQEWWWPTEIEIRGCLQFGSVESSEAISL
jgi:hypothetical protein